MVCAAQVQLVYFLRLGFGNKTCSPTLFGVGADVPEHALTRSQRCALAVMLLLQYR